MPNHSQCSKLLLFVLLIFEILVATRIFSDPWFFVDPSFFLWPIVALAPTVFLFVIWKVTQILSRSGGDVRGLRNLRFASHTGGRNGRACCCRLLLVCPAARSLDCRTTVVRRLIDELGKLRTSIESGEREPASAVEAIETWVMTHIHTSDEDLAHFLKQASQDESPSTEPVG